MNSELILSYCRFQDSSEISFIWSSLIKLNLIDLSVHCHWVRSGRVVALLKFPLCSVQLKLCSLVLRKSSVLISVLAGDGGSAHLFWSIVGRFPFKIGTVIDHSPWQTSQISNSRWVILLSLSSGKKISSSCPFRVCPFNPHHGSEKRPSSVCLTKCWLSGVCSGETAAGPCCGVRQSWVHVPEMPQGTTWP